MKNILLVLVPLVALAGCATTRLATPDERAYCERMASKMGTGSQHDHGEAKGMGPDSMNISHARCRRILAAGT